MSNGYKAVLLGHSQDEQLQQLLGGQYQLLMTDSISAAAETAANHDAKLILLDLAALGETLTLEACVALKNTIETPVVLLAEQDSLDYKMQAYEAGCDDYLTRDDMVELKARLDRVLFNKVANDQLKLQLQQAHEMAFIAMSDTSDLGVNVQFLLEVNRCSNLDELGMRLFQSLKSYALNCSLQMRSSSGTKNMEANGMAKEMESMLLAQCADQGRYVDFGRRSIMNYGRVSLLVKNMPVDDAKKYGAIKDNVFSLLQGADARIEALDNLKSLALESELVRGLGEQLKNMMTHVDQRYQEIMRRIADVVENMADGVDASLQYLGMDEHQEAALQKIMENGIEETSRVFSEGVRVDSDLKTFLQLLTQVFADEHADPEKVELLLARLPAVNK
ncbi:MAG: response regulator receiver protein [Oceanospirillaceae bacterium]|nr:response regulator receiver protein [Oceanospirillaceae bacterium]MBT10618.1 response regulator receiver protein [Oceanospirillaceae bacterium]|tara:strand:+ start:2946 stop:4118 length:1173 start_codon:yes stop_codon:yes gene_type:complete